MVTVYGLNKRIGNRSYYDSSGESNFTKPYSEETARIIDEEVSEIIERAYERAKQILSQNRSKLQSLAKKLLEKEVIFKEDLEEIIGKRKFPVPSGESGELDDLKETAEAAAETAAEKVVEKAAIATKDEPDSSSEESDDKHETSGDELNQN